MYLSIVFYFFLFINLTKQDESLLSFDPSSISIVIDENKLVNVRLLKSNVTFPISISFLYDDEPNNTEGYIDSIPGVTFSNPDNLTQTISIIGRHEGHLVLTAQSSQINISTIIDYVLIDIGRSEIVNILIQIVGWIYFLAWSISFYPQIILNFRRRSVVGLNFDFLALNILGHSCYSVFNVCLYTSTDIQKQYYAEHPHGVLPVLLNDVSSQFLLIKF
jgi:cystinosin